MISWIQYSVYYLFRVQVSDYFLSTTLWTKTSAKSHQNVTEVSFFPVFCSVVSKIRFFVIYNGIYLYTYDILYSIHEYCIMIFFKEMQMVYNYWLFDILKHS